MTDKKQIVARVELSIIDAINSIAEKEDRSFSQIVRKLLSEALENRKKKKN